jgi:malate synthase
MYLSGQDGRVITRELYKKIRDEEFQKLTQDTKDRSKWDVAMEILDKLILRDDFVEFLTFVSNDYLVDGIIKGKL